MRPNSCSIKERRKTKQRQQLKKLQKYCVLKRVNVQYKVIAQFVSFSIDSELLYTVSGG